MMDAKLRDGFTGKWEKYFNGAALPIAFWYTNDDGVKQHIRPVKGQVCMVGQLALVRRGETLAFDADSVGCGGGKRYMGFTSELRPGFEYFLSSGIPGKMEGERYKKSPELVLEALGRQHDFVAPGKYIVFKRWDALAEADEPEVVIFFAKPDVLSGLFTLSGFDEADYDACIAPFGAGCGTIIQYPYLEKASPRPRSVVGMFDVSARPWVEPDVLSFATPIVKFRRMIENMDESFLITESWQKVRKRIASKT